jgi:signal transduction histidine kinase
MSVSSSACPLATVLADRIRESNRDLTRRWLDRIAARVAIDINRVFPTEELLDHVPLLMVGIADYLEHPNEDISADAPVVAKARELGELRHKQGFDAYEILKEYELLGGVLFSFLSDSVNDIDSPCTRQELLVCAHRLFRAIEVIQQSTTTHFLAIAARQVREREERLMAFNRMVSHELKDRVGTILGARTMLGESFVNEEQRKRFLEMIGENAEAIRAVLDNLVSLSRLDQDSRQQRNLLLPRAVAEVVRQLRDLARARDVEVVVGELPEIEVNAAAVELCLTNYISNAIKYSDQEKAHRRVEISGELRGCRDEIEESAEDSEKCELVVCVRDNGLGVPAQARERLFERFFRADEALASTIAGTGLGLSIVRETIASLGGRAWAEHHPDGTIFAFSLPARREVDSMELAR